MEATAAFIMTNDPVALPRAPSLRARDARPLTLPPGLRGTGDALGDCSDGGRGADEGRGGGMDRAAVFLGTAGGGGQAPVGAQGATVPPAGAVGGAARGMAAVDVQLAAAQAAAVAIVDGDDDDIFPSAVAPSEAAGAASAAAAPAQRTALGLSNSREGAGGALDPLVSQPLAGLDGDDEDGGEDDEDECEAAAAGARPTRQPAEKRLRRDWKVSAAPTAHPPANILPSDAAVNLAKAVITTKHGVHMLRKALVIGNNAVAKTWLWWRARFFFAVVASPASDGAAEAAESRHRQHADTAGGHQEKSHGQCCEGGAAVAQHPPSRLCRAPHLRVPSAGVQ